MNRSMSTARAIMPDRRAGAHVALAVTMMRRLTMPALAALLTLGAVAQAKVVGTMTPAEPITEARIARLPQREHAAWLAYLRRSRELMAADKAALAMERTGLPTLPPGPPAGTLRTMPLDRPASWYAGDEARRIADNILSFQTPAGGWSKNQDRTAPPRVRGQHFAVTQSAAIARLPGAAEPAWTYVGTIDNGATHGELRFLARVIAASPGRAGDRLRASFQRGVNYLLAAQFPNGGWPQVFPLQGGYHDAVTFNDDAVAQVATLMREIGKREGDFAFVDVALARTCASAATRASQLIVRTQVVIGGKRTIWGQQHDALTLAPVGARNFEPAALAAEETVGLIEFLKDQGPGARPAIAAATDWLKAHALHGVAWRPGAEGRKLVQDEAAGSLWSRYYSLTTGRPIFGDRDRTVHDDVNQISRERRDGYSWFTRRPCRAIAGCV